MGNLIVMAINRAIYGLALIGGALTVVGCDRPTASKGIAVPTPKVERLTYLSDVYEIDRQYRSMAGPWSTTLISLGENTLDKPLQLLWILGFSAEMVGADGKQPALQEYMCHSNVDFDRQMPGLTRLERGIFTLSQGQFAIRFPEGFGVPIYHTKSSNS